MASKREIKELLRKALGATMSEAELDALADALSSKGTDAPDPGTTDQIIEAQVKLNEELGRTKEALEAIERLRARQVQEQAKIAAQLDETGKLNQEEVERLKEREKALNDVSQELNNYNRKQEESAELDRALGSVAQNVSLSYFNMADAGVKLSGVFGKLGRSYKAVTKSFNNVSKANDKFAASMDVAKNAMEAAFNSNMAQAVKKQGDILNQLAMQAQRWSDISKTMQSSNQELYKQTGQLTANNMQLASKLGKIGDSTRSLLMEDKALVAAEIELRNSFAFFSQETVKTQNEMLKTTALVQKAGMSAQTTAENYSFFTKALGMSGEEAEEATRGLLDLSRDVGQSPEKVASDFSQAKNFISTYGRDGRVQFIKMTAISGRLGVNINKIMSSMDSMDTISGASETSAKLNAVLNLNPADRLSAAMLNQAKGAEKFMMIANAIGNSKVDLATSRGRLREAARATKLSESDILKIQKLKKDKDGDLEKFVQDLVEKQKDGTTTANEIDKQNQRAMTADEKANKALQKGQLKAVEAVAKLQNVMAENVMAVKAFAAVFSALGMMGPAMQAFRGGKKGAAAAKAAGKSGFKGGLGGAVSGAASAAGAMRVYVVNTSDFGGGGGGFGGGGGGGSDTMSGGGGSSAIDTAITTALLVDDVIDTGKTVTKLLPAGAQRKIAEKGTQVASGTKKIVQKIPMANKIGEKTISTGKKVVNKIPIAKKIGEKIAQYLPKVVPKLTKYIPGVASVFQGKDAYDRFKKGDISGGIMQTFGAITGPFTGGLGNIIFEVATEAKDAGLGDYMGREFGNDPFNPFANTAFDLERHRSPEEKFKAKGMDKEGYGFLSQYVRTLEMVGQKDFELTKVMRDLNKLQQAGVQATMKRSKAGKEDPYGLNDMIKGITSDGLTDYDKDLRTELKKVSETFESESFSDFKPKKETAGADAMSAIENVKSKSIHVKSQIADTMTAKKLDDFEFQGQQIQDVKEGGLLADKLERLIQLAEMVDEEIEIKVSGKKIATATLSAINNNIYG